MPLTEHSAVVRRLVVNPGPASADHPRGKRTTDSPAALPPAARSTAVSAVLGALGRPPHELPVRTAVYLGGTDVDEHLVTDHEGFPVRTASTPGRALLLAHHELLDGTVNFALVGGFGEPAPDTITVYAVKRAAEAVADGDPVLGVVDPAVGDNQDMTPPLRPLRHGGRVAHPDRHRLFLWSGQDEADETRVRGELLSAIDSPHREMIAPSLPPAIPFGTAPGPVRGAAVAVTRLAESTVLKATAVTAPRPRPLALLLPGQGSQHHAMAAGLYGHEPVFTAAVDAVLSHMGSQRPAILADWLSDADPAIDIDDVRRAQPLLFAVDYALGRMVLSWGVRPVALLGHSAGELAAAALAGVMPLPDAVQMVLARVEEAVKIPPGGMLAVAASERQLRPYLDADVAIAAVNANQQVMLAGSTEPLARVQAQLRADGLTVVTVPATSPFHSPAMAPASRALEARYADIPFREPSLPLYSGYTGGLMRPEDACSPRFWARQVTDTVHFLPALEELLAAEDVLLVEAGPRQTLTAFARRHRAVRLGASAAVALLPARPGTPEADRQSTLNAAARLWTEGHTPNTEALSRLWTWSATPAPSSPTRPLATTPA